MKHIQLMYLYRNGDPTVATHQFQGECGYEIERSAGLSAFWDKDQTLIVPTGAIVNVHIT